MVTKNYRPVVRADNGEYQGAALVGVHSAIVGWSTDKTKLPKNHLGFAVRRKDFDPATGELMRLDFLGGFKRFDGFGAGVSDARSDTAPFQRFRWNDYTLDPARSYSYEIFPVTGKPGDLQRGAPLIFNLRPSPPVVDGVGVFVNRGVTAAKAFFDRFGDQKPTDDPDPGSRVWLERGLLTSLLDFIADAKKGESLHVCIYEFFLSDIAQALKKAKDDGVNVEIVYHSKGDHASHKNHEVLHQEHLDGVAIARTNQGRLNHNKFVVGLTKAGKPVRVWTGSANFSENAFYYQTNSALTFDKPDVAVAYEDYYQLLRADPKRGRKKAGSEFARDKVMKLNATLDPGPAPIRKVMFSAVRDSHVVDAAIELLGSAKSASFLSAPFGIGQDILAAVEANSGSIIEYGLANTTAKNKIAALNHDNTRYFWPSKLERVGGERWDAKAFGAHKIHAKALVIDPFSDSPTVLIGSANFSEPSCKSNDENTLLIEGDKRLAAILTTEFMRMYDHYKSRYWIKKIAEQGDAGPNFLKPDSSWSKTAFDKNTRFSHKYRDRLVFSGTPPA